MFISGLDVDGIYRVSGNLSSINKLRGLIDNGMCLFFVVYHNLVPFLWLSEIIFFSVTTKDKGKEFAYFFQIFSKVAMVTKTRRQNFKNSKISLFLLNIKSEDAIRCQISPFCLNKNCYLWFYPICVTNFEF